MSRAERRLRRLLVHFVVLMILAASGYGIMRASVHAQGAQKAAAGEGCLLREQMTIEAVPATKTLAVAVTDRLFVPMATRRDEITATAVLFVPLDRDTANAYLDYHFPPDRLVVSEDHFHPCICRGLGLGALVSSGARLQKACQTFYDEQSGLMLVIVGLALGILAVNEVLKKVLEVINPLERPLTKGELGR